MPPAPPAPKGPPVQVKPVDKHNALAPPGPGAPPGGLSSPGRGRRLHSVQKSYYPLGELRA